MKHVTIPILLTLALASSAGVASAAYGPRISIVYAGGGADGTAGSTFASDYVEIFYAYAVDPIDLSGWVLEYAPSGGNWGSTPSDIFVFPEGTVLPPCSYVLVAMSPVGPGGAGLPAADFTATLAISAAGGSVGLFNRVNADAPCGSEVGLRDRIGYGPGACPELAAIGPLSPGTAAVRNDDGRLDTDWNQHDFMILDAPVPRNSSSPINAACVLTPTARTTWGELKIGYR